MLHLAFLGRGFGQELFPICHIEQDFSQGPDLFNSSFKCHINRLRTKNSKTPWYWRRIEDRALRLVGEEVAEFAYRLGACKQTYRVIVLRKNLVVAQGQMWLCEPDRYFCYITNDQTRSASEIVFCANDRCNQENLIAQLKGRVKALAMPVNDLVRIWASMVLASLAWSLKT